jgi:hypothetical protein
MSKLNEPRFSIPDPENEYQNRFYREITDYLRAMADQVNAISENRLQGACNAVTASPTGVVMAVGDIVRHSDPGEEGTAGAKYIVTGWMATIDGTASAGSVVELRSLTGN